MRSRRQALKTALAVSLPVLQAQQHSHPAAAAASPYKPKWATAAELKQIAELADILIPRTETPGASGAKVQEYIDYALANDKRRQAVLREGLKWFFTLPAASRLGALTKASQNPRTPEGRFFKMMKDLTIDGYYQSREGLTAELGWHGNTFLPEFKGCTHPEHKG